MASDDYYQADRRAMVRFLPARYARVLEVGCASGRFSDYLAPCELWGVEPNAEAAEAARTRMQRVLTGTYGSVERDLPDGYFDLVVCNDVIEHIPDHDAFLDAIRTKMSPDGYLVGSVPNFLYITTLFRVFIEKDWPYSRAGIFDRTHLRFFTAKSLRRTLHEHGYVLERFEGLRPPGLKLAVRATSLLAAAVTLGYYWDTQYLQYGFRARVQEHS